jgi:HEAT repeat protein
LTRRLFELKREGMTTSAPKPKSPAASHMLLFFVIPCLGFIIWASWNLIGGFLENKPQDIPSRIAAIKTARSSGDRWQAVYALSQELQKMKAHGEWESMVTPEQKAELFSTLTEMQDQHAADLRFKKYVLLTLGQFGDESVVAAVRADLDSADEEIRFYSAWAFLELLGRDESIRSRENLDLVLSWISGNDVAFKKIATTFLIQYDRSASIEKIKGLLEDPNLEVRWNAAVALASVGEDSSVETLSQMFEIDMIRKMNLRSVDDLKQLMGSAVEAAQKLGHEQVFEKARRLRDTVSPSTPEGSAIHEALNVLF